MQKMRMVVQHPKERTDMQTALLNTCYTDLYSFLMYIALRVPQAVYTSYEDPWFPI